MATNFVQNREGNCATFWAVVVANFATTTADGELEQESNLHILQKCSSTTKYRMQIKKATRLSGLAFTMVEQRLLTANTIYANSVEIKVTRNWFAVVTFCESNNKK